MTLQDTILIQRNQLHFNILTRNKWKQIKTMLFAIAVKKIMYLGISLTSTVSA